MAQYLFIIGAAKCGTTALADMLHQHPEMCLSDPKESDFFTDRIFEKGFDWYEKRFAEKPNTAWRLDASVSYTAGWKGTSKPIAERIHQFHPNAKIMYLVRDPIARTWSAYWHAVRNLKEKVDFRTSIANTSVDHITASKYSERIADYLEYFPKENFKVIDQTRVSREPQVLLDEIMDFIGLDKFKLAQGQLNRQVNASYQFNAAGSKIFNLLPLGLLKKLALWSNRHLPAWVNERLRKAVSNPVPKIEAADAMRLVELYRKEVEYVESEFGIDLKTSPWWKK